MKKQHNCMTCTPFLSFRTKKDNTKYYLHPMKKKKKKKNEKNSSEERFRI